MAHSYVCAGFVTSCLARIKYVVQCEIGMHPAQPPRIPKSGLNSTLTFRLKCHIVEKYVVLETTTFITSRNCFAFITYTSNDFGVCFSVFTHRNRETGEQAGRQARTHPFNLLDSTLPRIECFPKRIANGSDWQTSCCYSLKFIPIFLSQFVNSEKFWAIVFRLSMALLNRIVNTHKQWS